MGEYRGDWFSFEIKSKRRVMDLIIEPSFAKSACFQVHEMKNDSFQLFWNFGMTLREMYPMLMKFAKLNQIDLKTAIAKIFIADLDADDMALVDAVVNAKYRPPD